MQTQVLHIEYFWFCTTKDIPGFFICSLQNVTAAKVSREAKILFLSMITVTDSFCPSCRNQAQLHNASPIFSHSFTLLQRKNNVPMAPVHGNFVRSKTHLRISCSFNHLLFHTESDINIAEDKCKMDK